MHAVADGPYVPATRRSSSGATDAGAEGRAAIDSGAEVFNRSSGGCLEHRGRFAEVFESLGNRACESVLGVIKFFF